MRNINEFLFSVSFLFAVNVWAQPGHFDIVVIERSPSTCIDMADFFESAEERVDEMQKKDPEKKLVVDYNTIFLRLFHRLKDASDFEKELWRLAFELHSKRLAEYYNVCGLKIQHVDEGDISLVSALIKPLLEGRKLERLGLTSTFRPKTPELASPHMSESASSRLTETCLSKSPVLAALSPLLTRPATPH